MTLTVAAAGAAPINYQWYFKGQPLAGATGRLLALSNAKLEDSGPYYAVVSNAYGTTSSRTASVAIYLPPSGPLPEIPIATAISAPAPPKLTTPPRKPSSDQLVVFSGSGRIDPKKMTIVLTHGWRSSAEKAEDWPARMANKLMASRNDHPRNGYGEIANIVAWNWKSDAAGWLPAARGNALGQGEALGAELHHVLGAGYAEEIHFIGHSLGTIVNCRAANYIHGDTKNSLSAPTKFLPHNTHMTLLDEADISDFSLLFRPGDFLINGLAEVIPKQSRWVDNYISEVGSVHHEAANVMLWRNAQLGLISSHGYAYEWYADSIANPDSSRMGHRWSFERGSIERAPARGTYFGQVLNADPWTPDLVEFGSKEVEIAYPTAKAFRVFNVARYSAKAVKAKAISYLGSLATKWAENFTPPKGQPVFLGTAHSTPAYFIQEPADPSQEAQWELLLELLAPTSPELSSSSIGSAEPDRTIYTRLVVDVPVQAAAISFEFRLDQAGEDEFFSMGIADENYFTIEAKFIENGQWNSSGPISIAEYAGQTVDVIFALTGAAPPRGKLSVGAIRFSIAPAPELQISLHGSETVLTWPATAIGWQSEMIDVLGGTSKWTPVPSAPTVLDYHFTITNTISSPSSFFRLRKPDVAN